MQIKLVQSIRANGKQYRPPSVVDTKEIGITDGDAEVLVMTGVATVFNGDVTDVEAKPVVEAEAAEAPAAEVAEPEVVVPETVGDEPEAEEAAAPAEAPAAAKPAAKTTAKKR